MIFTLSRFFQCHLHQRDPHPRIPESRSHGTKVCQGSAKAGTSEWQGFHEWHDQKAAWCHPVIKKAKPLVN